MHTLQILQIMILENESWFSQISDDPANICEHTLTIESGWIVAPGYERSGFYENSVDCMWKVFAPDYLVIRFQLHFLDIEPSTGCLKDHLIVSGIIRQAKY